MFFSLIFSFLIFFHLGLSLNQEALYLHRVKKGFLHQDDYLSNWNERDDSPCRWTGVICNSAGSVVSVDLSAAINLKGTFPTIICSLENLNYLSLANNYIGGDLPLQISNCKGLHYLDLSQNVFVGKIPETLANLPDLLHLDLSGNNFSGEIPTSFARFQRLENLSLVSNLLNSSVPAFLGKVSTLKQLNLTNNPFAPSKIPSEIGNLTKLEQLWLSQCNLIGEIPENIGHLRNLKNLDLSENHLTGFIPKSITMLKNIVQIELYDNNLSGEIPAGMSNLTLLRRFDASVNNLQGEIPEDLCKLPLESLHLYQNGLYGKLPDVISKSTSLYELRLFENSLEGTLPADLGKHSPLRLIEVSFNRFSGEIPASLCENGILETLILMENSFSGQIPVNLGKCHSLNRIRLSSNGLSGEIPADFWGLPKVDLLELSNNSFSGKIAPTISKAKNLSSLFISFNRFSGEIPIELGFLHNLRKVLGDNNQFTGPIPKSLACLRELETLDLHNNEISGDIFPDIQSLQNLAELNLAHNHLSGSIPHELGKLQSLTDLDLSMNCLTGQIPTELENLKLSHFNLSYNRLSGRIPRYYSNPIYTESFLGNPGLCDAMTDRCPKYKGTASLWFVRLIFALAALIFILGTVWFYLRYRKYKKEMKKSSEDKMKWTLTSFHKVDIRENEIFDCLDENSVIGCGSSGKVYKHVLSNGEVVAVKKLWGKSTKGDVSDVENGESHKNDRFEAEVETLGKVRHKNIVKLMCSCTKRDSKLLVYQYMPNGSLGDVLHRGKSGALDWQTRYQIMLDAAEGLSYLHHDCKPPIIHRDVKSNNILLDGEFRARLADFGVSKEMENEPKPLSMVAGSCGYIAPEYAYTLKVNEKSDVYSFGVVILELLTGKPPLDPQFGEKDIVNWICTIFEQKGAEHVLDPQIESCFKGEMLKVLHIALQCTSSVPLNRPSMRRVVNLLIEVIQEKNNLNPSKKDGNLSPYYNEDNSI